LAEVEVAANPTKRVFEFWERVLGKAGAVVMFVLRTVSAGRAYPHSLEIISEVALEAALFVPKEALEASLIS
jgi:hypothetical protein